jgi:Sec-independent protein translocase protein TatA
LLSPADMLIIGAAALLFFGPDQLPKVAKRAGQVVREVQNTSQAFIREMERAADDAERVPDHVVEPPHPPSTPAVETPAKPATDSYEV